MFDNHNPFPHLSTRRIILKPNKVKIEGLLSTEENTLEPYWFRSGPFAQYVRFYFVLYRDSKVEDFAKFHDENTRARQAWAEFVPIEALDSPLVNHALIHGFTWDRYFDSLDETKVSYMTLTLSEIIDQHNNFVINLSMSDMTREQINDIYFEVEVPLMISQNLKTTTGHQYYIPQDFSESQEPLLDGGFIKDLRLMCFSHLDVRGLVENYNLSAQSDAIRNLFSVGGNMTYDYLLEPTPTGRRIPPTRSVFYVSGAPQIDSNGNPIDFNTQDPFPAPGSLYVGEKLLYTSEDPGPGNYVGWVASHRSATGEIVPGPRLEKRELPQTKVLATIPITSAAEDLGYIGFEMPPPGNGGALDPGAMQDVDISDDPARTARGLFNFDPSTHPQEVEDVILAMSVDRALDSTEPILNEETWIDASLQVQSTLFTVDIMRIVANNSNYGYLLKLHKDDEVIVSEILKLSNIKNLSTSRNRLTDTPSGNTQMDTGKHVIKNKDNPAEFVAASGDKPVKFFKNKFKTGSNFFNKIEELNVDYGFMYFGKSRNYYRSFAIRDGDLYNSIERGKYSYVADMEIEDGIKTYFLQRYKKFKKSFCDFQKFLHLARIPYRSSNYYYGPNALYTNESAISSSPSGNYDYKLDEFTQKFIASHGHSEKIKGFVEIFAELAYFTHKIKVPKEEYLRFALPESGSTLETAELLFEHALKYERYLLNMVDSDNKKMDKPPHEYGKNKNFLSHLGARSSARGISQPSQFVIKKTFNLKSVAESFQQNELIIDYDLVSQLGGFSQMPNASGPLGIDSRTTKLVGMANKFYKPHTYFYNRNENRVNVLDKSFAPTGRKSSKSSMLKLKKKSISRATNKNFLSARAGVSPIYTENNYQNILSLPFCVSGFSFTLKSEKAGSSDLFYNRGSDNLKNIEGTNNIFSRLTREMQTVLCESAYKRVNRSAFLEGFLDTYKSMTKLKEQLGATYDNIFNIINFVEDLSFSYGLDNHIDKLNETGKPKKRKKSSNPEKTLFSDKSLSLQTVGDAGIAFPSKAKKKTLRIFKLGPPRETNTQENIKIANNIALIEV